MASATINVNETFSDLHYGGHVKFDGKISDRSKRKGYTYYVQVIVQPLDSGHIMYQCSRPDNGPFPLVDQQGDNLDWPEGLAGRGSGYVIERIQHGQTSFTFHTLAECHFTVEGA